MHELENAVFFHSAERVYNNKFIFASDQLIVEHIWTERIHALRW